MDEFLQQVNEVWQLHDLSYTLSDPPDGGVGCLVFVVDDRYIEEDDDPEVQLRLAVTFGENIYPEHRERGWVEPDPAPGKFRFGVHMIGIRGKRIAVLDMYCLDHLADDCETAEDGERRAREILAIMSDEDYARNLVSNPRQDPLPTVRLAPLDVTGFELIANEEHL